MKLTSKNITISGLNKKTSNNLIVIISVTLGMIIFALIPFVANKLSNPVTSALLNVVPNGMILGFFIIEKNFDIYFKGLIFAPLINTVIDIFVYFLYRYLGLSTIVSISTGIFLWLSALIICYFIE